MREVLLRQAILVIRRVTLRLGVEWQRHFVRGKRRPPPWWRSSVVDFGWVTERRWRCTRLGVLWALAFACRHRLGGVVQDVIGRASVSRGRRRLCRTTLHDRVYSGVCIPLALTSLLTILRFRIYFILRAFTFLASLFRIGYRLQVFLG